MLAIQHYSTSQYVKEHDTSMYSYNMSTCTSTVLGYSEHCNSCSRNHVQQLLCSCTLCTCTVHFLQRPVLCTQFAKSYGRGFFPTSELQKFHLPMPINTFACPSTHRLPVGGELPLILLQVQRLKPTLDLQKIYGEPTLDIK